MELLKVDTLEEARTKMTDVLGTLPVKTEERLLLDCSGYILSEDMRAEEPVPGFTRSTVDGYALRWSDTGGASDGIPAFLTVAGEVRMGEKPDFSLQKGECAVIWTGGMLPEGADTCVMLEYCEACSEKQIMVYRASAEGENVVREGEDMRPGDVVLHRGEVLTPRSMGVLSALGRTAVPVFTPWRVTIISTGDELAAPGERLNAGQVRDINTYGIYGLCEKLKFNIRNYFVLKDDKKELISHLETAKKDSDIILISGGSSKGKKDVAAEVISQVTKGGIFTHGLALKPGKPVILGYDSESQTFMAGLPGHPAAAMLVFELLIQWLWEKQTGSTLRRFVPAEIPVNIPGAPGKCTCQLVRLEENEAGNGYRAVPLWGKSGLIHLLAQADGYLMIEENQEGLRKGSVVKVYLLDS